MKTNDLKLLILAYGKHKAKKAFRWFNLFVPKKEREQLSIFDYCYLHQSWWIYL